MCKAVAGWQASNQLERVCVGMDSGRIFGLDDGRGTERERETEKKRERERE